MDRRAFLGCGTGGVISCASWPMNSGDPSRVNDKGFAEYQQRRRQELWALLGDLPKPRPPAAKLLKTERKDGYILEHLELDLNGIEPAPALLLLPDQRAPRAPGLLYIHAHGGTYELGKEELVEG